MYEFPTPPPFHVIYPTYFELQANYLLIIISNSSI